MEDYNLKWSEKSWYQYRVSWDMHIYLVSKLHVEPYSLETTKQAQCHTFPRWLWRIFLILNSDWAILYNSHILFHIAGSFWEQKEPTGMNIFFIHICIYTCYIMYTWYWYAWKIQQWCSILYRISSCFKREGRQIVTFSKLGSSVLFKQNSSQVPVPKPGGKPHTSYMFKHCKFPRGHTLLSQGGNNGNNGGQTVELVELGWFGDGWEEDIV